MNIKEIILQKNDLTHLLNELKSGTIDISEFKTKLDKITNGEVIII